MVETIIAFIVSHSGVVTLAGGWVASELLAFVPVKANSIVQLLAQFLVSLGTKIIEKGNTAATKAVKCDTEINNGVTVKGA